MFRFSQKRRQAKHGMMQRADIMKIMFICTGNTCRSPLAEAIFANEIKNFSPHNITFKSAGLAVMGEDDTSENSVKAAKELKIEMISKKSKPLLRSDLEDTDIFFVMTQSHKNALMQYVPEEKIYLPKNQIPDPYGQDFKAYRKCAVALIKEMKTFISSLFSLNLKPLSEENIKYAAEIEKECFSKPWSEASLREEITNDSARFFVLFFGEIPVGYGGMHVVFGEAYIDNIAVFEKYRGYGFGEYITKALMEKAEKENCEFISLEVRKSNVPAITLYKKLLFKKVGSRKNFYTAPTEDAEIYTYYFKGEEL